MKTHDRLAQERPFEPVDGARPPDTGFPMLDVIFIVSGIAFFILASAYAEGCDRL